MRCAAFLYPYGLKVAGLVRIGPTKAVVPCVLPVGWPNIEKESSNVFKCQQSE